MDPKAAREHKAPPEFFSYESRDAIIYALGIGNRAREDLRYVYENDESFAPYPTYVVAPGLLSLNIMSWPGIEFDLSRILHGEQYIEIFESLPASGKLRSETRVVDLLDKGSGALILSEVITYDDATNKKLSRQLVSTFQVGGGGFGGNRSHPDEVQPAKIPESAPDAVVEEVTNEDQATLYRMGSLDLNPLHVDPEFATMSGFKQPILHGLCSMGFATRHIIKTWTDNDASKLQKIKVRFSAPVLPGQTLRTEMWKNGNKIIFQTKVKETDKVVIANGWMELKEPSEKPTIIERLAAKL
ncbi:unnamed protein product [Auanema sp. JU1783]|nr:unnamed protein product [Auanema sp. JU1783]